MFDPTNVKIAVALVKNDSQRIAISWNDKWQAFVLPMTKIAPSEGAEHAAMRAAADTLRLPVRVVTGQTAHEMRKLQLSGSDGEIKDYHFSVVQVEVEPDFHDVMATLCQAVFSDAEQLRAGEYRLISPSVKPILDACVEWGLL